MPTEAEMNDDYDTVWGDEEDVMLANVANTQLGLASRMFAAMDLAKNLEMHVETAIRKVLGIKQVEVSPGEWDWNVPFLGTGYDPYDGSFELYGVAPDYVIPIEVQKALAALGFARGWSNSNDPEKKKHEKYYDLVPYWPKKDE
jgi:hypothetical protein